MRLTGRDEHKLKIIEEYLKAQQLWRNPSQELSFTGDILELDLQSVQPSISGPKRPHDRVTVAGQKEEFGQLLTNPTGFKGYGMKPE